MEAIGNADLIWTIVGLAGLVLAGLLYGLRQYHVANRELKARLETTLQTEFSQREQLHVADKKTQALQLELEKERALASQKIEQFEQNRKQLKIEFENLANRVLDDKTRVFDKTSRNSLEALLKPFREQVEGFQKRVNDVHSESIKGTTRLESEIRKVLEVGLKMGSDARNLTEALKGDSQRRGSWGETQLEKTLQLSGLIEHDHYEKQTSMKDAEGKRKQTDFLIKLPDDKHIIIDSKVSLAAYDRLVAAETDDQHQQALAEHVKAVKSHIDDLQSKDYASLTGIRSPSFVLMFMPIEPAYIEALKYEKDLFAYGYERGIVLVSHTTLIPILTTVANLWAMERSTREARELGDKAGDIYNQVRKVTERLAKIGGSLGAATNHFNETVIALTGRQGLRGKVERFAEISSKVTKAIPEIEPLHNDLQSEKLELLAEPLVSEKEPEKEKDEAPTP
ncbi:MAG: DNA recombination protein RmuC [Gammaproteobacteria bacterium]|nr:DNA recombination protein RmuC [Gammaproteobacteria bacterium]MDH3859243.1 DNA recombination protein RmuC [Gammaproteobacteria bacterium]